MQTFMGKDWGGKKGNSPDRKGERGKKEKGSSRTCGKN